MSRIILKLTHDERIAFIAAARAMLGAPFRHQGRTRQGMDCLGFVYLALVAIGKRPNNRTDYGRLPANLKLEQGLLDHLGPPISKRDILAGDVVSMSWADVDCHVGIVTPHRAYGIGLIHCYLNNQRVVEHGIDATWLNYITGVYRT